MYAISRKISAGYFQWLIVYVKTADEAGDTTWYVYSLRFQEESFILDASCMFDGDVIIDELTSWLAKLARFIPEYKPHTWFMVSFESLRKRFTYSRRHTC